AYPLLRLLSWGGWQQHARFHPQPGGPAPAVSVRTVREVWRWPTGGPCDVDPGPCSVAAGANRHCRVLQPADRPAAGRGGPGEGGGRPEDLPELLLFLPWRRCPGGEQHAPAGRSAGAIRRDRAQALPADGSGGQYLSDGGSGQRAQGRGYRGGCRLSAGALTAPAAG